MKEIRLTKGRTAVDKEKEANMLIFECVRCGVREDRDVSNNRKIGKTMHIESYETFSDGINLCKDCWQGLRRQAYADRQMFEDLAEEAERKHVAPDGSC